MLPYDPGSKNNQVIEPFSISFWHLSPIFFFHHLAKDLSRRVGTKEDKVHRLENVGYAVLFHPPDHREGSELDVGSPFFEVFIL